MTYAFLLLTWAGGMTGGAVVVPGIDTEKECQRVHAEMRLSDSDISARFKCMRYVVAK